MKRQRQYLVDANVLNSECWLSKDGLSMNQMQVTFLYSPPDRAIGGLALCSSYSS